MKTLTEIIDSITSIIHSMYFSESVVDTLRAAVTKLEKLDNEVFNLNNEKNKYQDILYATLKTMIGEPIYWASPNWKMETHTIRDVRCDILDTDFFDTKEYKYEGTLCVIIDIDENGYYIADNIGKNLFFDKGEAIEHSKHPNDKD